MGFAETRDGMEKLKDDLKENFMFQLMANRICGGLMLKTLRTHAERARICTEYSDVSPAVNELIQEKKVSMHIIGGDVYLWLAREPKDVDPENEPLPANVTYRHCWEAPGLYEVLMSGSEYLAYKKFLKSQ